MKNYLGLAVVMIVTTGLSIGFRHATSGTSKASQRQPAEEKLARAAEPALPKKADRLEGAAFSPVDTGSADDKADSEFARVTAAMGDRLLDRARQSPDNPHLLRQAAAHYRAALAHEPTVRDADDLFAAVREKLAGLDREIAALAKAKPKTTSPAAVVRTPAARPFEPAAAREPIMFGPDGAEIRRFVPRE